MTGKITPFRGLTPDTTTPLEIVSYELSNLFASAGRQERYNPDDLASRKGLGLYAKMMTDEQVKAVVNFRLASITARGYEFTFPDDSKLSEDERAERIAFYTHVANRMRGSFADAMKAVLRGHIFGYSLTEKIFDVIDFGGRPMIAFIALLPRDPSWFHFFTDRYGTLLRTEQWIANDRIVVDIDKFIHYVRAPEEDRYYGQSDLRAAYRSYYFKDVVLKLYGIYLERFAGGFAYAEIDSASGIAVGHPEYTRVQSALADIRNMAALMLPSGVKLNFFQPGSTSEYREALTYFDLGIAKSVLVPNLLGLSHTGQTGAYSQSQTQLEAYFMTTADDSARLVDVLNEQLFNDLGRMNWGDDQYPSFTLKPASAEHVKWMVETWKGLTGSNVVQTTESDEAHLRKLLGMPARKEEDKLISENVKELEAKFAPKEPAVPFTTHEDVVRMIDVLTEKWRDQLDAHEMRGTIERIDDKFDMVMESVKTPNAPSPLRHRGDTGTSPTPSYLHTPGGHDHDQQTHGHGGDGSDAPVKISAALRRELEGSEVDTYDPETSPPAKGDLVRQLEAGAKTITGEGARYLRAQADNHIDRLEDNGSNPAALRALRAIRDGKMSARFTSDIAFTRASARVDFAIIDRRTTVMAEDVSENVARLSARATRHLLTDERLRELLDQDTSDIGQLSFESADVGKIKAAFKDGLARAWTLGGEGARSELAKGGQNQALTFADLRNKAAEYFESNGFRMAANLTDGMRAIIQQSLLKAVKNGEDVEEVAAEIYQRLITKGFTTLKAVTIEETRQQILDRVEQGLREALNTANVPAYLNTLVRTNTFEALNEARYAAFKDPDLEGFVVAFEYSAVMDTSTTEICASLDDSIYDESSEVWDSYRPPNHYNCRSLLIPIFATDGWDGVESSPPTVEPQEGF